MLAATLFKEKLRGIRHSRHSFPQGLNTHTQQTLKKKQKIKKHSQLRLGERLLVQSYGAQMKYHDPGIKLNLY